MTHNLNFVSENIIYIHGEFDQSISEKVFPPFYALMAKEKDKKEGKIIIDINSDGGITYYLKQLISLVEKCKSEGIIVETRVFARAYSCGSMLAMTGSKGHRFIGEFAEHLCHLGAGATGNVHTDKQLERGSERIKAHFDFVRSLYKKYAKIPNLNEVIKDDNLFVRGNQIIEWGLADKIF